MLAQTPLRRNYHLSVKERRIELEALTENIVKECAAIAKKWQHWNDNAAVKVNIDAIILDDFGLLDLDPDFKFIP